MVAVHRVRFRHDVVETVIAPAPEECRECGVRHSPEQPHDRDSLRYQFLFQANHRRVGTWSDAMDHCTDAVKRRWRSLLRWIYHTRRGDIPIDLSEDHDPLPDATAEKTIEQ